MPLTFRQFPWHSVSFPAVYYVRNFEGSGTIWDLSLTGGRFSGDLPLRVGEVCSLTVSLRSYRPIYIAAAIVQWARGDEYGVDILVIDDESCDDLAEFIETQGDFS